MMATVERWRPCVNRIECRRVAGLLASLSRCAMLLRLSGLRAPVVCPRVGEAVQFTPTT